MERKEENAYILGTEYAELHRLGLQHQVWGGETRKAWQLAEFGNGQTILDLGCGPGYCTMELAYMAGYEGKVIGIDRSEYFIGFLRKQAELHGLENIDARLADFADLDLTGDVLDAVYARWALAWVADPAAVIRKIADALCPGGVIVAHEYYDWATLKTEPHMPALAGAISAAFRSLKEQEGDIDIGRRIPGLFYDAGLEVISVRPMAKLSTAQELTWQWPRTFFHNYFPKLQENGYLTEAEADQALEEYEELGYIEGATIFCPQMVEIIAVKP